MSESEMSDCLETLLDLVCYEICRRKLTPETKQLFLSHLAKCQACRMRTFGYLEILGGGFPQFHAQSGGRN